MESQSALEHPLLSTEQRNQYIENLRFKHGLAPDRLLPWLMAYRFTEHWEADAFPNASPAVRQAYSYGVFSGERNATFDAEMREMVEQVWDCRQYLEFVFTQGVEFYPVMDALLMITSDFMDCKWPTRWFHELSTEYDPGTFSMDMITFTMRFYLSQSRKGL